MGFACPILCQISALSIDRVSRWGVGPAKTSTNYLTHHRRHTRLHGTSSKHMAASLLASNVDPTVSTASHAASPKALNRSSTLADSIFSPPPSARNASTTNPDWSRSQSNDTTSEPMKTADLETPSTYLTWLTDADRPIGLQAV